jgi:membrane protease YdiL (CAAX protease family)
MLDEKKEFSMDKTWNDPQTADRRPGLPAGRRVAALLLGTVPLYLPLVLTHALRDSAYGLTELLLWPLCGGMAGLLWVLAVYRFACRQRPSALNRKEGGLAGDAAAGLILWVIFNLVFFLSRATLYRWLPSHPSSFGNLFEGLRGNPWLLFLWLGPVVWIGVAAFEEVSRTFLLDRIWALLPGRAGAAAGIALSVALVSLAHLYQGPAGMASVGLLALVSALYYRKFGRLFPLIIAHALYDSFWVALAILQVRL